MITICPYDVNILFIAHVFTFVVIIPQSLSALCMLELIAWFSMRKKITEVGEVFVHRPKETMVEIRDILIATICDLVWTININLHSQNIAVKMQSPEMLFLISSSPRSVSWQDNLSWYIVLLFCPLLVIVFGSQILGK